ncbi:DUF4412 domain-containing protein [Runella slithyformis]|uniref:DUF4412 domain-containing protein n=1 Tax=Runella slithyformis (strain ATCC 29530 / DSM 19594 / LMG 11500 / NCIMB 11436 / LSU 4) TaxID=761193 RepID=A0A7U3ZG95_RUNSL|nr:DUF4412 domain-containing protein [Runella slithyformis]AEI46671.1 hypothetical protein Runsl_0214 [Runella slithyformis DSM 19594]
MKQLLITIAVLLGVISAQAQQGTIEYKMTMSGQGQSNVSTSKMQFASGKVRLETNLAMPGISHKQVMLMLPDKPNTMVMLNEASKTYTEVTTKSAANDPNAAKVTVKVVGKEKLQNLNCTHIVVTMSNRPMDMWTTKDIAGYEGMMGYWKSSMSGGNDQMYNELKKAGAEGFVVKTQLKNPEGGMTMDLVKYDTKPVSAAVFTIPSDYKKGVSFDPEKIKNMTPAERRKAMEQMMKQYGGKQ